jgi:hypothetical protein
MADLPEVVEAYITAYNEKDVETMLVSPTMSAFGTTRGMK